MTFVSFTICGLLLFHLVLGQKDCLHKVVFIITAERRAPLRGNPLYLTPSGSLQDCIRLCTVTDTCTSANFYKDPYSTAEPSACELMDSNPVTDYSQLLDMRGSMYYAWTVCLPSASSAACDRSWVFELVPNLSLKSSKLVIDRIDRGTVEECFVSCLKTADCRSIIFHRTSGACELTMVNRHAVRDQAEYFVFNPDTDLYENNCLIEPSSACHFMLRRNEGVPNLFNSRIPNIRTGTACKEKCLANTEQGLCRSFTFDIQHNICLLSHISPSTLPLFTMQRMLVHSDYLEMGEIDDCIAFALKCRQDGMLVHGQARRLFSGHLTTRSNDDLAPTCGETVRDQYYFDSSVSYQGCGTKQDETGKFTNLLFVKYGDGKLITYRDRLLKLICKILRQEEIEVQYQMHVTGDNSTKMLIVSGNTVAPRFKLQVLDSNLKPINRVAVGESGYLEIEILNAPVFGKDRMGIQVPNVVAVNEDGQSKVELFDENGCTLNPELASSLRRVGPDKIRAKINFFAFQNSGRVHYKGLVKPCWNDCSSPCPDLQSTQSPGASSGAAIRRTRRNIIFPESIDVLREEQYAIETGVLVQKNDSIYNERYPTLKEKEGIIFRPVQNGRESDFQIGLTADGDPESGESESANGVDPTASYPGPLAQCFSSTNAICAITMTFALIQLTIFVLCFIAAYHYLQCLKDACRRFRKSARISRKSDSTNKLNEGEEDCQSDSIRVFVDSSSQS